MFKKNDRSQSRERRHMRVRKKIFGTAERPRLSVYRSEKHIYAQLIDDIEGKTLVAASSAEKGFDGVGSNKEGAKLVGKMVAEKALEKGLKKLYLTEADSYITEELKNLQKVQEKQVLIFKKGGK